MAVLTSAALLGGCASGGGSSGGGRPQDAAKLLICAASGLLMCPPEWLEEQQRGRNGSSTGSGTVYTSPPVAAPLPDFTSWAQLPRGTGAQANALHVDSRQWYSDYPRDVRYDSAGRLISFASLSSYGVEDLAAVGHAGIDIRRRELVSPDPQSRFTSLPGSAIGAIANPYALGWNYQSFGVWDRQESSSSIAYASSFGSRTPGAAVPTSGSASFTGKLAGLYVSPSGQGSVAAANVHVNANFSTRSLGFSTSGTTLTRDARAAAAAPQLNLSGSLTYAPGINAFSGTLSNAGGTMSGASKGHFHGPAAQELGGVFSIRAASGSESFTGAYGARR